MKVVTPGHKYELDNMEGGERAPTQNLQFIQKAPTPDGTGFATVANGTTNEEVLRMLIDRIQFLQAKHPCRENAIVITKLEESLMWLEKRTADRIARNVEGTNAK